MRLLQPMKKNLYGRDGLYLGLLVLLGGYLVFVALRLPFVDNIYSPTMVPDELFIKQNALAIYEGRPYFSVLVPPLYSICIVPAFWASDFYSAIKVINILLLTLSVFPVYLIARLFLNNKLSLFLGSLFFLLSFQWIAPSIAMTENLIIPLFLFSVYCLVKPFSSKNVRSPLLQLVTLGLLNGLMLLTRHQALALVVVTILFFCAKLFYFDNNGHWFSLSAKRRVLSIFLLVSSIMLVFSIWFIAYPDVLPEYIDHFFSYNKGSPEQGISDRSGVSFLQWCIWYISYLLLAISPLVVLIVANLKELKDDLIYKKYQGFLVFVFLTMGAVGFVAVRHSYNQGYNYPVAQYVLGRYITYGVLLVVIAAFIVGSKGNGFLSGNSGYYAIVIALVLILSAYFMLYGNIGAAKADGFNFGYHPLDTHFFKYGGNMAFVFSVLFTLFIGVAGLRDDGKKIMCLLIAIFFLTSTFITVNGLASPRPEGTISQKQYESMKQQDGILYLELADGLDKYFMQSVLDFWEMDDFYSPIRVVEVGADHGDPYYVMTAYRLYGEDNEDNLHSYGIYSIPLAYERLNQTGFLVAGDNEWAIESIVDLQPAGEIGDILSESWKSSSSSRILWGRPRGNIEALKVFVDGDEVDVTVSENGDFFSFSISWRTMTANGSILVLDNMTGNYAVINYSDWPD